MSEGNPAERGSWFGYALLAWWLGYALLFVANIVVALCRSWQADS